MYFIKPNQQSLFRLILNKYYRWNIILCFIDFYEVNKI